MPNTRTTNRLLDGMAAQDAAVQLYGEQAVNDIRFLHVVLAQCGLPYKNPGNLPMYVRKNGSTTLALTPGALMHPKTGEMALQGLPYGPKPRLLMIHLCTEAIRSQAAEINIGDSMSAFMQDLGLAVTGGQRGSITSFKEQMNRLAASRMQFGRSGEGHASTRNPAPVIQEYDIWFPRNASQRMLWPTTVTLSTPFFESLLESALPLDPYAIRSLQSSSMALDVYTWLAHRLWRIPSDKPCAVSWVALKSQFGTEYGETPNGRKNFRQDFREALKSVRLVYKDAKVAETRDGRLELRGSKPPVPRIIEGKSTNKL